LIFNLSFVSSMRRALLTVTCGAAFSLLAVPAAQAMGFGRTITATTLGQPLNFAAVVALDADESLNRECVTADVLIGDSRVSPDNVRATLETGREPGERRVRVTTRIAVDEPIVTINVTVGCQSRVSRRFVAFIDPPMVNLASAAVESLPPQRVDNQVVPLLDIVRGADGSRRAEPERAPAASRLASTESGDAPRPPRRNVRRMAAATVVARADAPRRAHAVKPRKPATIVASASGTMAAARTMPRLRLDAASGLSTAPNPRKEAAGAAPPETTSSVAAIDPAGARIVAAQAAVDAASAALGRERDRIQLLEAGMATLKGDSDRQQKTLLEMQARLRQAEGERYANGLVYALSGGMLFFALLSALFWAVRPRQRRRARWFDEAAKRERSARAAGAGATSTAKAVGAVGAAPSVPPAVSQHPSQWGESAPGVLVTAPATIGGLEVTTVLAPQSHYQRMSEAAASANAANPGEETRPLSSPMEELIDLEQQAEFFAVLGQDDAAIALLDGHLHSVGATSPLPYLQLLEIHQRRGDQTAYEKVRRSFERQFKAIAPEWSADIHFGRSLDEYPQAVARLQAIWAMPLHAMESLDGLIFRRSENDESFDFPAYRDLLFLYSIARDRAGAVDTEHGPIDLLLPFDDAPTEPMPVSGDSMFAVDLDISEWPGTEPAEGFVIRRSVGRRGAAG
jgi:pilus assembly protein FimV